MEEPLPVQESLPNARPDAPPPPAMSFAARLLNVFAIPGEVFETVRANRFSVANWLLPAVLLAVVGVLTVVVMFSQPSIQKQMREQGDQQAKSLELQVKAGKVAQADAEQLLTITRWWFFNPDAQKIVKSVVAVVTGVASVFWWAFILWLGGRRFLKVQFGYLKTLEVAGLALLISVLGQIVVLALTVNPTKIFAAPSLALVAPNFEANRESYLMLGAALVFAFWQISVLSVGLARLARVPYLRAAWFVFAIWVIQEPLRLMGDALGQFRL